MYFKKLNSSFRILNPTVIILSAVLSYHKQDPVYTGITIT